MQGNSAAAATAAGWQSTRAAIGRHQASAEDLADAHPNSPPGAAAAARAQSRCAIGGDPPIQNQGSRDSQMQPSAAGSSQR